MGVSRFVPPHTEEQHETKPAIRKSRETVVEELKETTGFEDRHISTHGSFCVESTIQTDSDLTWFGHELLRDYGYRFMGVIRGGRRILWGRGYRVGSLGDDE